MAESQRHREAFDCACHDHLKPKIRVDQGIVLFCFVIDLTENSSSRLLDCLRNGSMQLVERKGEG